MSSSNVFDTQLHLQKQKKTASLDYNLHHTTQQNYMEPNALYKVSFYDVPVDARRSNERMKGSTGSSSSPIAMAHPYNSEIHVTSGPRCPNSNNSSKSNSMIIRDIQINHLRASVDILQHECDILKGKLLKIEHRIHHPQYLSPPQPTDSENHRVSVSLSISSKIRSWFQKIIHRKHKLVN